MHKSVGKLWKETACAEHWQSSPQKHWKQQSKKKTTKAFPAPEVHSISFGISDPTSAIAYSNPTFIFNIWVVENALNSVYVLGTWYFPDLFAEYEDGHHCLLWDANG